MTLKKMVVATLTSALLLSAAAIAVAEPASAITISTPSPITVSQPSIANGGGITVSFGAGEGLILNAGFEGTQAILCPYINGTWTTGAGSYSNGNTVPATTSVAAGTADSALNLNPKAVDWTYTWAWINVVKIESASPTCADIPSLYADIATWGGNAFFSSATVTNSASYTVTPAIQSPVSQTLYVGVANTAPTPFTTFHADFVTDLSGGSDWLQASDGKCGLQGPNSSTLPASLSLDTTPDATANELAPLVITGTPTAADIGDYTFCFAVEGTSSTRVYLVYNLTIAAFPPAPAPEPTVEPTAAAVVLAETGTDDRIGLWAGLLVAVGLGLLATTIAVRRRDAKA